MIASSFSDAIRSAAEGMKGMRIGLYEWEYLKLGDQKGLRLAPIFGLALPKPKKSTEKKGKQKPEKEPEAEPMREEPELISESPMEPEEAFKAETEEKGKRKLF